MYLQDFFNKYNGKKIDYDGAYGAQCVDLFRFFNKEVLGIEQPKGVNGAKNFWTNYGTDQILYNNFTKIDNTPSFVPQFGDIAIWSMGEYGHIAICPGKGNTAEFESFDQNFPVGSACKFVNHNYKSFLGVLRPKNQNAIKPEVKENYKTLFNMHVRIGAGTNYRAKAKKELTPDGQKNATSQGLYKAGTVFTALEIITNKDGSVWAKSPSGYIALRGTKGEVYCNKV